MFSTTSSADVSAGGEVLLAVGRIIGGTISTPIIAGTIALMYIDRRMRREGLDLALAQTARERQGPERPVRSKRLDDAAPLTRDGAAHAAHAELSKHIYQQARPSLVQRVISAVWRWLVEAYHRIVDATPGGALGLLVIIAALAGTAVFFAQRRGVSGRRRRSGQTGLDLPADGSSDQLRAEADALAARGEWAEAVRARLRAVVRTLEERGMIDPRPGRTAAEVAAEAGAADLTCATGSGWGAQTFGEIWYGRRPATVADDAVMPSWMSAAGAAAARPVRPAFRADSATAPPPR